MAFNQFNAPQPINDTEAVARNLTAANSILIVLPQRPTIDSAAAGLALFLSLSEQKKKTVIACANPMTVTYNRLFGVDKVVQNIGNKNLVISFPCPEESLEKVSYNIDSNVFNLVIERKGSYGPVPSKDVSYNYTGVAADLVLVIGANRIEDLGSLYQGETTFFAETQVVNINHSPSGVAFGKLNIFDPQASSVSELVAILMQKAQLPVNGDLATNLVAGIEAGTNNLAHKTGAKTFELMAWLMASGAKRGHLTPAMTAPGYQPFGPGGGMRPGWNDTVPFGASVSQPMAAPFNGMTGPAAPPPFTNQPNNNIPRSMPFRPPKAGKNVISDNPEIQPFTTEPDKENYKPATPQPDWFKPKIFKGKTKV